MNETFRRILASLASLRVAGQVNAYQAGWSAWAV